MTMAVEPPVTPLASRSRLALAIFLATLPVLFLLGHVLDITSFLTLSTHPTPESTSSSGSTTATTTSDTQPIASSANSVMLTLDPARHGLKDATEMLRLSSPPSDATYERYRPASSPPLDAFCFLYDRPPRTGSTTIGSSLRRCLKRRFSEPATADMQNINMLVRNVLKLNSKMVMLVSTHLHLSLDDVLNLRRECAYMLYISSCRPMRERLWSVAKYKQQEGHGNSTLTEKDKEKALLDLRRAKNDEMFLENHPWLTEDKQPFVLSNDEKIFPDYVVRHDDFNDDLGQLWEKLMCDGPYSSKNVHELEDDSVPDFVWDLKLNYSNRIFKTLTARAALVNDEGLRKAEKFIQMVEEYRKNNPKTQGVKE